MPIKILCATVQFTWKLQPINAGGGGGGGGSATLVWASCYNGQGQDKVHTSCYIAKKNF